MDTDTDIDTNTDTDTDTEAIQVASKSMLILADTLLLTLQTYRFGHAQFALGYSSNFRKEVHDGVCTPDASSVGLGPVSSRPNKRSSIAGIKVGNRLLATPSSACPTDPGRAGTGCEGSAASSPTATITPRANPATATNTWCRSPEDCSCSCRNLSAWQATPWDGRDDCPGGTLLESATARTSVALIAGRRTFRAPAAWASPTRWSNAATRLAACSPSML